MDLRSLMSGMGGEITLDQYALLEKYLGGMDNLQSATINARNGQQTPLSGMSPIHLGQLDRYTNLNSYAKNSPFGDSIPGKLATIGSGMGFMVGSEALKALPENWGEGIANLYSKFSGQPLASSGQPGPFTQTGVSSPVSFANIGAGFEGLLRGYQPEKISGMDGGNASGISSWF